MLKGLKQLINKEKKNIYKIKPQTIKKITIRTYISIITLSINGISAPTKRYRMAEWIQKQDPYTCSLQEIHFRQTSRHIQTESERMEIYVPYKRETKEVWSSYPHIRQNRP